MHLALPSPGLLTQAVSQTMSSFASRASTAAKSFESDLDAGNVSGAQSFLSALQQSLSSGNSSPLGSSLNPQFAQVNSDLTSGNLSGAQSDFSNLEQAISQMRNGSKSGVQPHNNIAPPIGQASNPSLAFLEPSYALQQSAFNSALSLSMPASPSGFSASF